MSKEFRIGLIALVAGVLLYYGFNYLKGTDVLSDTNRYYVVYDNTDGLGIGSAIKIQGVQVGRVSEVLFQPATSNVLVELDLQGNIELGDSTVAELTSDGLLGGKAIILYRKTNEGILKPGAELIPSVDKGLSELMESGQQITDNLQITIRRINEILVGMEGSGEEMLKTIKDLDEMIKHTNQLIVENREGLKQTIGSANLVMESLNSRIEQLDPMLENMTAVSDSLKNSEFKATISSTNDLLINLNSTLDSLKNNQGTIGRLMSEDSLYNNLNKTLVDLDKLLIHFNNYPKDFLGPLGKKNKRLKGLDN